MDLRLTAEQEALAASVRTVCARLAGPERARECEGSVDRRVLDALGEGGFLDVASTEGGTLLDALLVVEVAEEDYARAPVAARAVVAPLLVDGAPGAIGLVDPTGLVRYAGGCDAYLSVDGDQARYATAAEVRVTPTSTRWGYPLGRVEVVGGATLGPGSGRRLEAAWRLALAAEMGGCMRRAVRLTARYVSERHQFGRPIATFQAVSHRLARAAVAAEATTWLARRSAADPDDGVAAAVAATYGAEAARLVSEATHQVTGAIGITREYDLVLSTMRLGVLQSELGGARRHALAVSDGRWPALAGTTPVSGALVRRWSEVH